MKCGRGFLCKHATKILALTHTHGPANDTLFFFDRCCFTARASILCEYEGRDLVISKSVYPFLVFSHAFYMSPSSKSPFSFVFFFKFTLSYCSVRRSQ